MTTIRFRRWQTILSVLALSATALGARCIEHTTVHVDSQGYTHLSGEMYNDTDIQGHQITVHGRILDSAGNVIAEQDGAICPPDLHPHSQAVFDLQFAGQNLPPAAAFDVRPASGLASDIALPDPNIAILATKATAQLGEIELRVDVQNNSGRVYHDLNGCVAAYDAAGSVVAARSIPFHNVNDQGTPLPDDFGPAPDYLLYHLHSAPTSATTVRGWLWLKNPATGGSDYAPMMTSLVAIQR